MIAVLNQIFSCIALAPEVVEDAMTRMGMPSIGLENIPGLELPLQPSVGTLFNIGLSINNEPESVSGEVRRIVSLDTATDGFATELKTIYAEWYLSTQALVVVEIYDNDGNLYDRGVYSAGTTVTPSYDGFVYDFGDSNGYYKWRNTGAWIDQSGTRHTTSIPLGGDIIKLYPEKELKANMTVLQYNLTLSSHFTVNIGLPAQTPEGIGNLRIDGDDKKPYSVSVDENGVEYRSYPIYDVTPFTLDTTYYLNITMSVKGPHFQHGSQSVTQVINGISAYKYINTVLEDSLSASPRFGREVHTMMADLLRYAIVAVNNSNAMIPGWATVNRYDESGKYVAYTAGAYKTAKSLEPYLWLLTDLGDDFVDEKGLVNENGPIGAQAADDTAREKLPKFVELFTYNFFNSEPRLLIVLSKGNIDDTDDVLTQRAFDKVVIEINEGWIPSDYKAEGEGYNWGYTKYERDDTWVVTSFDSIHWNYFIKEKGQWYLTNYYGVDRKDPGNFEIYENDLSSVLPGNIPFYNLDKEWTITINYHNKSDNVTGKYTGAGTVSGTYSMASYYCATKAKWEFKKANPEGTYEGDSIDGPGALSDTDMYEISDFVYATYACSRSIAAYRFSKAIDSNGNVVEY